MRTAVAVSPPLHLGSKEQTSMAITRKASLRAIAVLDRLGSPRDITLK